MRFIKLIIVFITISSLSLLAQSKKIKFSEETLDNGLQVIYNIDKSAPNVAIVVYYKVGSKDENPERTGFAHFFEHLMFESTTQVERGQFDELLSSVGGANNAYTSTDETVYHMTLPSNELKLGLWLEASRMRNLKVEEIGVETQRGVVKEERNNRYDNSAYGTWYEKMLKSIYVGGKTYSWSTIGVPEHINQASIKEFQDFYNNFYQPNNAILSISGDISITEAKKIVKEYFGSIAKAKEPVRSPVVINTNTTPYKETVEDKLATLPAIFAGTAGPKQGEKDFYAVQLLWNILFRGESSEFYKKFISDEELAVQIAPLILDMKESSIVGYIAVPTPGGDVNELDNEINSYIKEIAKKGITDSQLEKAKNIIETSRLYAIKDVESKAIALAQYKAYYNNAELINSEMDNYLKITKADIKRVIEKYLLSNTKSTLIYVPKSAN